MLRPRTPQYQIQVFNKFVTFYETLGHKEVRSVASEAVWRTQMGPIFISIHIPSDCEFVTRFDELSSPHTHFTVELWETMVLMLDTL